jgi:23S rRNA pseudouridine1911/1915/1917 synthase
MTTVRPIAISTPIPITAPLSHRMVYAHSSAMTADRSDPGERENARDGADPGGTRHAVTAATAGGRLDRLLADSIGGLSRSRIKALIEDGRVSCGGATITDPSHRVKPGQNFAIFVPEAAPALPLPQAVPLTIVHEDGDLIVIDKPAGMVVHPAPGNTEGTLVNALLAHCGDSLSGIGGVRRPGIVHRLDKDTSGLIVAAKNDAAHESLSRQFEARTIERAYMALVWGIPTPPAGEIEGNIGRSPKNRKKMAVRRDGGKPALTRYKVLRRFGRAASLVECRLATGRTHQIRVHMAHIGHPVIGDATYGGGMTAARRHGAGAPVEARIARLGRQALHARLLGFRHPKSGKLVKFESSIPLYINELICELEKL